MVFLRRSRTETDMTTGSIYLLILGFAIPLLLGNIFQQLYNTVDTWVVGNYVGKHAFSAVGTLGPVTNTIIGFFVGFSSGAGVVISRQFGAKDNEGVSVAVHTFVAVTLISCVAMTAIGIGMVPLMIKILGSPKEVAPLQKLYLTIYFSGVSGLLIYNAGASILRAVGNSFFPFLFLVVTTVLNIVLDLVFVLVFKMGTAGVALATIIAQAISAILVVFVLMTTKSVVKVSVSKIKIDREILKDIITIGLPSALQMSITAFSNVFVQSYINFFGTDVMAGWTAYNKIDQIFFLPMQSLALAATTFVGQNLGHNSIKRARKGATAALAMGLISTAIEILVVIISADSLVRFFVDDNESKVIYYGSLFLRMNGPFFLAACVNQIYGGALRGASKTSLTMANMLFSFVLFRQIYLFVMTRFISNTPITVGIGYPVGWVMCAILMLVSYIVVFPKPEAEAQSA